VASDGKTPKDTRTPSQRIALKQLLTELLMLYPNARIYGHHDFDKGKACPSFDARNEYKALS
jgi:N-acetylmuramoyl-L-alanine amidase